MLNSKNVSEYIYFYLKQNSTEQGFNLMGISLYLVGILTWGRPGVVIPVI